MILEELLAKKVINLPESKRLEEINKVDDPRYCNFDRVLGHRTTKCFILKGKIMMLVSEGKLTIDQDETAEENHSSVAQNQKKFSRSSSTPNTTFIKFESLAPIEVDFLRITIEVSLEIQNHNENEDDCWTLATRKKQRDQEVLRLRLPKTRET